jgi:uncharacterized protein involved in exopolysaccharide biosynthesis
VDQRISGRRVNRTTVRLSDLIRLLWSRRWLIGVVVIVMAVVSGIYSLTRPSVYESSATLAPVKDEGLQLGGSMGGLLGQVAGMAGIGLGGASLNETVEVLRSQDFSLRFMREHGIDRYLFPKTWDERTNAWKPRSPSGIVSTLRNLGFPVTPDPAHIYERPGPLVEDEVVRFDRIRTAVVDRRTEFVRLTMQGPTPEVARDWNRAMISELNESLRAKALADSRRAVDLLSKKVETEQMQSVRMVASALLEAQLRREVMTESRAEYAVKVLDPPSLPDTRYSPKRSRMVLIGALLGFLAAAVYVIGASAFAKRRPRSQAPLSAAGDPS